MNYFIVFLILIALSVSSLFVFGPRRFRKRAGLILEYTRQKGYRLANPSIAEIASTASWREALTNSSLRSFIKGSEGIADIEGFEQGTDDPFAFTCSLRSKEVMIFDFTVLSKRADDKGSSLRYKVAKIKNEGLPRFSLGRHSVVHAVETVVDKILGKPKSSIDVDPGRFPEFAKHYWLKGSDSGGVFAFLSPQKLQFLENTRLKGIIATNSNYLVYFESGGLLRENDFDSFIATAETIVANLL